MSMDELKQTIEQRTGVPAEFLHGETAEETIALARALLAYKRDVEKKADALRTKSTREQFDEWFSAEYGAEEPQDGRTEALAEIEEAARIAGGGYPRIKDGGEIDHSTLPDSRPTWQQFAEWFDNKTAFNPFKEGIW